MRKRDSQVCVAEMKEIEMRVLKRVIVEDITRERGEGVEFFSMIFF